MYHNEMRAFDQLADISNVLIDVAQRSLLLEHVYTQSAASGSDSVAAACSCLRFVVYAEHYAVSHQAGRPVLDSYK
jgi:hypothetical protein